MSRPLEVFEKEKQGGNHTYLIRTHISLFKVGKHVRMRIERCIYTHSLADRNAKKKRNKKHFST